MKKVNITDITLKTLAQDRAVSLLFREKTAIAACADSLGVNAIELAPIKSLREDTIIYRTMAQNVEGSTLAIPVGFSAEEVAQAWDCVKGAKQPRLQVEVPTSTVQMEYTYHLKEEKMELFINENVIKRFIDMEFAHRLLLLRNHLLKWQYLLWEYFLILGYTQYLRQDR